MGLIVWIVIGGLTGWFASVITKRKRKETLLECILAGIAGGLTAGMLTNVFFPPGGVHFDFSWQSTLTASLGAAIVIGSYWLNRLGQKV